MEAAGRPPTRLTLLARVEEGAINGPGPLGRGRVEAGLARPAVLAVTGREARGRDGARVGGPGRLDGQGLSHDGAAVSEQLQFGDGATTSSSSSRDARRRRGTGARARGR